MEGKREQAIVGFFVVVVVGLLLTTIFAMSGTFTRTGSSYRSTFKFAGGLKPGSPVSYSGLKVGRVEEVRVDAQKPGQVEILLSVREGVPVKTDSLLEIISLSALGENQLEIGPGSPDAKLAQNGALLPSKEPFGIAQLAKALENLSPEAEKLLKQLNERVAEIQVTIARVNDLINDQNRANVAGSLSDVRGMLSDNRPKVSRTLSNIEASSAKISPLLDDFKKTVDQANKALADVDAMIGENRPDVREAIQNLKKSLANVESLSGQLDRTLNYNAENIDEMLENMRIISENLKQFTDTIRARPQTLIRSSAPPDRKPGELPKN